ncbi:hypothetical protein DF268_23435 [Streptomyces sp. V2]|uniref:ribonuclease domain-containing protein n=1 Tax=Streptomyces sp. V2 TaxID=1424099 RepID=UPI000D669F85|nr:ribonuclease domain-containing protein [Streptomyces sp. V2]PWG11142.1 hypothetical protein DF268_23435 [Streptomyces sp. V2]
MSSTEALETPSVQRSLSSRLLAHARKAVIPALLLGATVGGLGLSTAAQAADGPQCPPTAQTCRAEAPWRGEQPNGVSNEDWNGANTAAQFWSDHQTVRQGSSGGHLVTGQGGWPGDTAGRGWYSFTTGSWRNRTTWWIYYGGQFWDRDNRVAHHEEFDYGVSAWDANGGGGQYREYDVFAHTGTDSGIRGKVRIVRNTRNGHVYATFDHYGSFHYLGRW